MNMDQMRTCWVSSKRLSRLRLHKSR